MDWGEIISTRGPSVTSGDLKAFEIYLSFSLPADYFAFMLKCNGGAISFDHQISVDAVFDEIFVDCLYPLSAPFPSMGIKECREIQIESRWYRKELIKIGGAMGTGSYFLVLDGPERGCVYFAYNEDVEIMTSEAWNSASWCIPEYLKKVTPTFDDLAVLIVENQCE